MSMLLAGKCGYPQDLKTKEILCQKQQKKRSTPQREAVERVSCNKDLEGITERDVRFGLYPWYKL